MSKQTNFKKIFIIIGVLLVLLLIVKLKDRKQGDRSFKAYVVQIDTSIVNNIIITPKGKTERVNLIKEGKLWMMSINNKKVQADNGFIDNLLGQVAALKTKSIAATSKDKWVEYEVTDSAASHIVLKEGKKVLSDFLIGKFSYKQPPQGQNPNRQRQNIQMTSYVRINKENEVYAVDGYLSMMFNRDADAFRNKMVVSGEPQKWKKLVYSYPADSSFTLTNMNNKWMVNGALADSASVATYFSRIKNLSNSTYDNNMELFDGQQAEFSVRIEADNATPIEVKAFRNNTGELVYISNQNKGNVLKSASIQQTLFVGKEQFIIP
ncbi:MAG: DUF4340 domain-containing protein [Salinivirgaceae bacterium]|jgi:hypothetical protein|nr:DUF4340 domain-containing protein [Salinivirgaceae bacterium]